jgi:hypothetical protein
MVTVIILRRQGNTQGFKKAFKVNERVCRPDLEWATRNLLAIAMGIIIIIADVYWLIVGDSYLYLPWLIAGIFVASIIWIYIDYGLMKK